MIYVDLMLLHPVFSLEIATNLFENYCMYMKNDLFKYFSGLISVKEAWLI